MEDKEFKVTITWLPGDIKSLRPDWDIDRCEEWLCENAKRIQDRSIELGWEVIEDLLPEKKQRCSNCMSVFDEELQECPNFKSDKYLMYPFKP